MESVNFIGFLKKGCNFFKILPTIRSKRIRVLKRKQVIDHDSYDPISFYGCIIERISRNQLSFYSQEAINEGNP